MAAIESLLLDSAKLSVAIQRAYTKVRNDPRSRYYFTYVLLLQNGKFYVGTSNNVYNRLLDHHLMSTCSSLWVREHGPVQRVVEVVRNCAYDDETYKTLEYMSMFGWQNVRGASYCRPSMRSPPAALAEFRRNPNRPFLYMSRGEIDGIEDMVRELAGALRMPPTPPDEPSSPS
jgi:hypothetical protein